MNRHVASLTAVVLMHCSAMMPTTPTGDGGLPGGMTGGGLPGGMTGGGGALPEGSGTTAGSAGTAPSDAVVFSGGFGSAVSGVSMFTLGGATRAVTLHVPAQRVANPPLVVVFHGTGGTPADFFDEARLRQAADTAGVILAAPQALERNGGRGEVGDPDHYEGGEGWGTSWNLTDKSADTNNDVQLVRAIIASARQKLSIDSDRVYALGHSNGAFFSYFVAALLPERIAAFAENSGGAVKCANRNVSGTQFTGTASTCAALSAQSGFPTCTGPLLPAPLPMRVPLGYLAHAVDDDIVSVAWTCTLASAMGNRGFVHLQVPAAGEKFGHAVTDDFATSALTFFGRYRRQD